jgi:hypothetical protein
MFIKRLILGYTKLFFLFFFVLIIIGLIRGGGQIEFAGPEEPVLIRDGYMCNGPDNDGKPTLPTKTFSSNQIEKIYLCLYVIPNGQGSLRSFWILNSAGNSFLSSGTRVINSEGYVFLSLYQDLYASDSTINYLSEELSAGYLPPGMYSVLVRQRRDTVFEIAFEIE